MAITRYSSFDKTVNTIAERNAILNKVNHMTVVVKDAIADPSAGAGKAVYRWDAVDENWILVSKSNCYTISFATEELTITNSEVQLSNYPVDNKVWNAVILNGNTILGDLNLSAVTISNSKITNIDPTYNGNTLRVTYAYGSIAVQINEAIEDKVDAAILNNVKTINGVEIIGTGNIVVEGVLPEMKTINSESILGTGDITISTAFADITSKPTTLSGYGITDAYTKTEVESKIVELSPPTDISMKADITYVDSKVAGIVDASPETLNTLNELAAALGDDPNFATTVSNQIGTKANSADVYTKTQVDSSLNTKVDKVTGKGLSTEDYTSAEKSKLASIENNANNYILPVASATVLGGVKAGTNISIDANGVISANDTSVAWSEITSKPTFATVATSGSYVDLSNKPTIPTTLPASDVYAWAKASTKPSYTYSEITGTPTIPAAQVQSDWNATTGMGVILNKPTIPTTVSSFTNDSGYQNATQVNTAIQAVVGAAPAALDTLAEIATQLANDESVVSALTNTVAGKQATLVSGTNIKTINGTSVLGSGDIVTTQTTITGNAGTATTLQTARTIGASGDVTGTATSFNGSANITIPMTLASVGTAGTYTKVTTDAKGRVTSGTTLSASDIPTLNQNTTGTAGSVVNSEVIKFDTGTTEGTDLYTFNGSSNKTIDIKAGTNITLTKTAGSITISANDTSVAWSEITSNPTTLSGYGITDADTSTQVSAKISTAVAALVGSSPATLDTLNELAAALGDDPNFATTTSTALGNRVVKNADIVAGTATKVTYDVKGLVVSGTTLSAADIPVLDAGKITTGVLPVVRGGTGTTTSTGTGDLVLSNSPVLVTPTIGVATGTSFNSITGLSNTAGLSAGIATIGTSTLVARQDHVHPVQTTISGNAGTATKLETTRKITIAGDASGSANFDGSADTTITIAVADDSHNHAFGNLTGKPTTVAGYGITDVYTKTQTDSNISTAVAGLVNGSPAALDTLNELAAALGNDVNFATTVSTSIGTKVTKNADIVGGTNTKITYDAKGLVTGGTSLAAIDIPALDWSKITTGKPTTLSGYGISDATPSSHIGTTGASHGVATISVNGFMSSTDKTKLDGIATNANNYVHPTSGIVTGTYTKITVDSNGHATAGSTPTTLAGYSIGDAYTKTESDNKLALKTNKSDTDSVNLLRADKYLAAQAVANMVYSVEGKLSKVQYNNATDVDYEVLTYNGSGKLSNVAHYTTSVLRGNTVLSYSAGKLVSAIYTGV